MFFKKLENAKHALKKRERLAHHGVGQSAHKSAIWHSKSADRHFSSADWHSSADQVNSKLVSSKVLTRS